MNVNISRFNSVRPSRRLIEANAALSAIIQLREYASQFAKTGNNIDFTPHDKEVVIIRDKDDKIRVDVSNMSDSILQEIGTRLTVYMDFVKTVEHRIVETFDPLILINDLAPSLTTTYSSRRIHTLLSILNDLIREIQKDVNEAIDELQFANVQLETRIDELTEEVKDLKSKLDEIYQFLNGGMFFKVKKETII